MKGIKATDKLNDVMKRPEFKDYKDLLSVLPGIAGTIVGGKTLEGLSEFAGGTWNAKSIAEGLDYLSKMSRNQKCFYRIWTNDEIAEDKSRIETGLVAFRKREKSKFVLICPGGAYQAVASIVEGFPVAKRLNELGYTAFVLKYRCGKNAIAPNPMDDVATAIKFILKNAKDFNIDIKDYTVMGFSAGGHLAAGFGTESVGYAQYNLPKPANMILAYPVITMGEKSHEMSRKSLLGKKGIRDQRLTQTWSIEKQITEKYPPTFVWQCDHDKEVPVENSQMLVQALKNNRVEVHYETFPADAHGWGSAEGTLAEGWIDEAVSFMKEHE